MWCSAAPQICICTINNIFVTKNIGALLVMFYFRRECSVWVKNHNAYFPFEIRYHFGVHFLFVFAILCLKKIEDGALHHILFFFSLSGLFSVSFLRIKNK